MTSWTLTDCEAEVMNALWPLGKATVPDITEAIPRKLAYTTVMTTMNILEEKGFVKRCGKRGRAYLYRPQITPESASGKSVKELAERFFDGSVKSMVLSLIKTKQITSNDLEELRDAIDTLEK